MEKVMGAPVALIDSVTATLMRKAMPVTMAVPSAGCVPADPSRRPMTYVASDAPAPSAYANARLDMGPPCGEGSHIALAPRRELYSGLGRSVRPISQRSTPAAHD